MKHNKPKVFINSKWSKTKTPRSVKNTVASINKLPDQMDTGLIKEIDRQNILRGEEFCKEISGLEGLVLTGDTVYGMGGTGGNTSGVWNHKIRETPLPGLQKDLFRSGESPRNVTAEILGSDASGEENITRNLDVVVPQKRELFTELDIIDS